MDRPYQQVLFANGVPEEAIVDETSTTFTSNMTLPVHRWFRYSAGFSARWAEHVIRDHSHGPAPCVLDPFAGSATTLLAAEAVGVECWGIDSHPFVARLARAKLQWRSSADEYRDKTRQLLACADTIAPNVKGYPALIGKCYDDGTLAELDALRQALEFVRDESPAWELTWFTLVAILRRTSKAGTAQWQYVLPKKQKRKAQGARSAFHDCSQMIYRDMREGERVRGPRAVFIEGDARTCAGVPDDCVDLVVTSPPYPNNYDYADATRLEMSFLRELAGWGDLQETVRRHLIRSCTQHVPERQVDLYEVLAAPELAPIREPLADVCEELAKVRLTKGGKKTYHLMVACYFKDLANVWIALRRVCRSGAKVCFVIGDSAPYGVYVPVIPWLGQLAEAAGFCSYRFEMTRRRNTKWKNRKHRVPLQEGRLWVEG